MKPHRRTGAARISDVPPEILAALHAGELETANLVEALAIDPLVLVRNVLPQLRLHRCATKIEAALLKGPKPTLLKSSWIIAGDLAREVDIDDRPRTTWRRLRSHPSDTVRGWAAFAVGLQRDWTIEQKLQAIRPLAADPHFGVRESAWLALRASILSDVEAAIALLVNWAVDGDPFIRRFASEATRPRGVWCAHSERLKSEPALGLPILEPLRSDTAKYVRDSVGNWLNDAAKSQPVWVLSVCNRWTKASSTCETEEIVKRARRSL